jgi:hypothetical protein
MKYLLLVFILAFSISCSDDSPKRQSAPLDKDYKVFIKGGFLSVESPSTFVSFKVSAITGIIRRGDKSARIYVNAGQIDSTYVSVPYQEIMDVLRNQPTEEEKQ